MPTDQPHLFPRFAKALIDTALRDTPVVLVTGPRQCGKTTLVRQFTEPSRTYITLDDATTLSAAQTDPTALVRSLDTAIIDEVQHAPDLIRAIKKSVDDDRRPGRFLLTGSANLLTLPRLSESLAGRIEIVRLFPLSQAELRGERSLLLENAFEGKVTPPAVLRVGDALSELVVTGGYPDMIHRPTASRRQAWARDYVTTLIERDVRDIADVEKLDQMPHLLRILAHHSGQLTNFSQIGGQIGLDEKTVRKYIGIFEQLFLVQRVEPWFRNPIKRLIKTPKLHFLDSGLLAALTGVTIERIETDRTLLGALLETFVHSEILKQASLTHTIRAISHYRDKSQNEVDIVVESYSGNVVGIEVKARATVTARDFAGLRQLAAAEQERFKFGMILYDGDQIIPFGPRLAAVPVSCL